MAGSNRDGDQAWAAMNTMEPGSPMPGSTLTSDTTLESDQHKAECERFVSAGDWSQLLPIKLSIVTPHPRNFPRLLSALLLITPL